VFVTRESYNPLCIELDLEAARRLKSMNVEENISVVKTVDKYFKERDWDGFDGRHSPDVISYSPLRPEPTKGRDEHREAMKRLLGTFPDFSLHNERAYGQGEWVTAEYTLTGTQQGPLPGPGGQEIPPTNKSIRVPVIASIRFNEDGLIAEEHIYFDRATMLAQLGVLPSGQ
jgi:steroid delta-isomerase-like uncharacterized protein